MYYVWKHMVFHSRPLQSEQDESYAIYKRKGEGVESVGFSWHIITTAYFAAANKTSDVWGLTPFGLKQIHRRFLGTCFLHLWISPKTSQRGFSETSGNTHQITEHHLLAENVL